MLPIQISSIVVKRFLGTYQETPSPESQLEIGTLDLKMLTGICFLGETVG